jgi:hypothetical protein
LARISKTFVMNSRNWLIYCDRDFYFQFCFLLR